MAFDRVLRQRGNRVQAFLSWPEWNKCSVCGCVQKILVRFCSFPAEWLHELHLRRNGEFRFEPDNDWAAGWK